MDNYINIYIKLQPLIIILQGTAITIKWKWWSLS